MPEYLIHIPGMVPIPLGRGCAEYRIGRTPDMDIVLEDAAISRLHARIFWADGEVFLEDLGSRHGCLVNGERIRTVAHIGDHDDVRLAHTPLRLELREASTSQDVTVSLALPMGRLRGWRGAVGILHEISLLLVKDLPAEALLHEMLDKLFSHLGAARGVVLLKEGGSGLRVLGSRGVDVGVNISSNTLQAVLGRREAQLLQESTTTGRGTLTIMTVPLEYEGEVLGLLYFDAEEGGKAFSEEELHFVAAMCNLATAKIMHQRMAEELQRRRDQERDLELARATAKAKSDFLARMSHEIRTPMNAILGFAQLAGRQTLPAPGCDYVRKIESSGRLLMGIINDILDLSKLEADRLELESIPMDLARVLGTVEDLFHAQAEEKGLDFHVGRDADLPPSLLGDPLRLTQVLVNLVGNALKFTEKGHVHLDVRARRLEDGRWDLGFSVADSGIGMPESFAQHLFEPFSQADSSMTRQFGGTGLGLSICKRLVDLMGGSIQVESSPGVGSCFRFNIVLKESVELPAAEPAPESRTFPEGSCVLVVEDYAINQEILAALLTGMGVQVEIASSGEEALRLIHPGCYAAVLMDVEMPGMNGLETTRHLRRNRALARLPIIAMTAHAGQEFKEQCLAAGMNEYLTKPVDAAQLHHSLGRWIGFRPVAAVHSGPANGRFGPLAPLMDVRSALARIEGNEKLLLNLIRVFISEVHDLEAIPVAMAEGRRNEALRIAHNLKGGARMLSIASVDDAAHALESCLLGETNDGWEEMHAKLVETMNAFQNLVAASGLNRK